ncbi:MAG TPA: DUF2935 domain-containing protein [Sedimentibacter sp.]|jgi:hypothetical protein|nr:DUF2935 domain-containing protein [Tissierellia bacterium]HAS92045.1 hypothetical protein [Clostridiales bacterium]HOA20196.1 DUF2935 domain-containing protein [Sedimentibacter sp.]HOG63714.1 DUF2935 domain-containing protein [Sedimentibacter sp.]HPB78847.1 DUF2935 domain-containing protein [Sedimentibacter sp.]
MSTRMDFVRHSLELHLFFARIMKEHSFFLEVAFTPRDSNYTQKADEFRREFDRLLGEVVSLSNGVVSNSVLQSGEVITPYTQNAEAATSYFTGIRIPTELTQMEANLMGGGLTGFNPMMEERVYLLNQKAMALISDLIQFKSNILSNVLSCKMFTLNYPLLIDHIMREAKLYLTMIQRLQNREVVNLQQEAAEQEIFWNRIMAEHAKFIRGLLDPTEEQLFEAANNFGNEFDQLTREAVMALNSTVPLQQVTEDSLAATQAIRDFKVQGTQGILDCKIKSIIIPLLGDHTIREANHFIRLLRMYRNI